MKTLLGLVSAVLLTLTAVGCAPSAPATSAAPADGENVPAATATVDVENIAFKPSSLKVLQGTTVTWVNRDAQVRHTATSGEVGSGGVPGVSDAKPGKGDGVFDGELPEAGAEFSFTFEEAGTFPYFCEIHPSMVATVVVE